VHSTSKHALLRVVISMTVAAVVAVAWAGSAFASTDVKGTLEICKSSLNGMSGKVFNFTVTPNGGSPIGVQVKGGRCSGPMQLTPGSGNQVTILEQGTGTEVASVRATPSSRLTSTDTAAGKAVVVVPPGSTVANETRVTFVNQPAGGNFGDLKICKLTETEAFLGKQFSFKVNDGPAISVEAGDAWADPSTWSCRLAGHFQVGTLVKVQELVPSEAQVAWIDTDPISALEEDNYSTTAGTATVRIGTGATVVMYDNEPFVPQGNGYIEVCKDRALLDYNEWDWAVQGNFHFTIEDQLGVKYERDVLVGQCTEPIQVAAGIATVTEGASNYEVVDAWTLPEERLQTSNLINRTATVEIPVSSDQNDETQVHFVNKTPRAQLKICKALGSGSDALQGKPFFFDVDTGSHYEGDLFKITAGATTQCKIWGDVPVGTDVTVDEVFAQDAPAAPLNTLSLNDLPSNEFIDVSGEGTITIKPGINTITITNTAMGQLELCKARIGKKKDILNGQKDDELTDDAQPFINFTVDGKSTWDGKKIQVRAGRCSLPLRVSVGNHVVVEQSYEKAVGGKPSGYPVMLSSASSDYELDQGGVAYPITLLGNPYPYSTPGNGIDVQPSDRLVAKNLTTRTVTVSVPFGKYGETLVTYYNRIRKGRIKICKQIPMTSQDSLGDKTFYFDWTVDGFSSRDPVALKPGECSYILGDANIIDKNGEPTKATVKEKDVNTTFTIDSINVQFSRGYITLQENDGDPDKTTFNLGPETNVVTYTNRSKDP
jgi:hypothetical protein